MVTTVAAAFDQLDGDLGLTATQRETADRRIGFLRDFYRENYQLQHDLFVIGSYARGTIIRDERDLDTMVVMDAGQWRHYRDDSRAFLYGIRDALNARYASTRVSSRQVAVRLFMTDDLAVDVVPAFDAARSPAHWLWSTPFADLDSMGYRIPDGHGGWQSTNPTFHDERVTATDIRMRGRLKTLVRLMKAWNLHRNGGRLRSFHLEMMIERIWHDSHGPVPPVAECLLTTMTGVTGALSGGHFLDPWDIRLRIRLDDYLDYTAKQEIAGNLRRDIALIAQAMNEDQLGQTRRAFGSWARLFPGRWPAFG